MPETIPFEKAQELGSDLGQRLTEGLSSGQLHDWIGDDRDRKAFLSGMVFGSIRWSKTLGRPRNATLASGFEIRHKARYVRPFDQPGDEAYADKWPDVNDIFAFDLPDDADDHRVGFNCMAVPKAFAIGHTGQNLVIASRDYEQSWESGLTTVQGRAARGVTGAWAEWFDAKDGFITLPEIVFPLPL